MSSGLVDQIVGEMQARSSEELLPIWVQNDRDIWSEEAFAAIKVVLEGRGVAIPAQGPAIRNAQTARTAADEMWLPWARWLLMVGVVSLVAQVALEFAQLYQDWRLVLERAGFTWDILRELLKYSAGVYRVELPLQFAGIAVMLWCRRKTSAGRYALLAYCWTAIGVNLFFIGRMLVYGICWGETWWGDRMAGLRVQMMVFPGIALLFFTRSQVKDVFESSTRGFPPDMQPGIPRHARDESVGTR